MALEGERVKTLQFCFYTTHTYIGSGSMWNMAFQFKKAKKMKKVIFLRTYPRQFGVRSLCRRFLNQLETWVIVSPVFLAKVFFSSGVGYRLILYVSFRELRDFSLKQYTVSSPSQMVRGRGNLRLSLYLSTAPVNLKKKVLKLGRYPIWEKSTAL